MTQSIPVPTPAVEAATALVNTPAIHAVEKLASHDLSLWSMFWEAGLVVKLVLILLLAASFWSWAIIFEKFKTLRDVAQKTFAFEEAFWKTELIDDFYTRVQQEPKHPIAKVFSTGMKVWQKARRQASPAQTALPLGTEPGRTKLDIGLRLSIKDRVVQAMNIARAKQVALLEKNLSFLATVGSTAPFVGLFGTVWGIMDSFQSIAISKNTTLAVVAPGIAEALFATAVGLFAAIPAVIFYNKFTNDLAVLSDKMEYFSEEFEGIIERELNGE